MIATEMLTEAARLCITAAGVFFAAALATGVWKYAQMATRESAQAHPYVDICHRTALMDSFAALLLAVFAQFSAWSDTVNWWAAALPLAFFAQAIVTYGLHGWLEDTDNQFRKPHRLGRATLPGALIHAAMLALVVGEIGGFGVLFAGTLNALW